VSGHLEDDAYRRLLSSLHGDDAATRRFIHDFVALWEDRAHRLTGDLYRRDWEDADVVLLSIRSSSQMVGARALRTIADRVHQGVRGFDLDECLAHLQKLHDVGRGTCRELAELVARLGPALP